MDILTTQTLGFIKKSFDSISAAQTAAAAGKIVFDSTHKVICVDGSVYGGNITNATFADSKLTILKADGNTIEVDFSDIASASRMMDVFTQIESAMVGTTGTIDTTGDISDNYSGTNYLTTATNLVDADKALDTTIKANTGAMVGTTGTIGTDGNISSNYSGTNYLTAATNLVDADKALDIAIKANADAIAAMDGTAGIASVTDGVVTLKSGVTQADGTISNDSGADITLAKVATTGEGTDVSIDAYVDSGSGIDHSTTGDNNYTRVTNAQTAYERVVEEAIDREQVTQAAISSIGTAAGLNSNLEYVPHTSGTIIKDATDITDALNRLDDAISDLGEDAVKDVTINGSSIKGTDGTAAIITDGTYDATNNKIATQSTVTDAIGDLDVTEYAQAEVDTTTTTGQTTLKIKGISETDGKIAAGTNTVDLVIDGQYDATNNKIATESTVTDAIGDLDVAEFAQGSFSVDGTTGDITVTINGISETDGKIATGTTTNVSHTFKKIADTGAAEDVAIADSGNHTEQTNVEGAIQEIYTKVEALEGSFDVIKSTNAANTPQGVTWTSGTESVTGTLVASAGTFHRVYLVPSNGGSNPNTYSEYITTKDSSTTPATYGWEKLGDIAVDLTGYVKSVTVNGKQNMVTDSTTDIALGDVITSVTGETAITGGNSDYVAVTATATKDSTAGTNIVKIASSVKTMDIDDLGSGSGDGLATARDVKTYVDAHTATVTNENATITVNSADATTLATVDGTAITAKAVFYWDEWESAEPAEPIVPK